MVEKQAGGVGDNSPLRRIDYIPLMDAGVRSLNLSLSGAEKHEMFAGFFSDRRKFKTLMGGISDPTVQANVLSLADEPEKLVAALRENVGGAVGPIPKHPIRAGRLADFLSSDVGSQLYKNFASTEDGAKAA
ncbi:MAG: hypothetical protein KKD39_02930, partial [Candidatus Altiarchaeota archaeon]|nr:hypothetical protein [Candidatus Altiarchaeota archaeon]